MIIVVTSDGVPDQRGPAMIIVVTSDGVSHAQMTSASSTRFVSTACGLEFSAWIYAGHLYGPPNEDGVATLRVGQADCVACLANGESHE